MSNYPLCLSTSLLWPAFTQCLQWFHQHSATIIRSLYFKIIRSFSADQLHDIDVKVGNGTYRMSLCGHVSGYTRVGGRMAVFCPTPTVGRYVQVQIVKGDSNYLSPAEVIVWGKRVWKQQTDIKNVCIMKIKMLFIKGKIKIWNMAITVLC